jgi:hypothetical protein
MWQGFPRWRGFLLRWLVVLATAASICCLMFFVALWRLPDVLAWARLRASFRGGLELVSWLENWGPVGVASLTFVIVARVARKWPEVARPVAVEAKGMLDVKAPRVFGAIPRQAWRFQPRPRESDALFRALGARGRAALVALPGARGGGQDAAGRSLRP